MIRSVWALELLLLLRRDPLQVWTPEALTDELRASLVVVRDAIATFKAHELLETGPGEAVRWAPRSDRAYRDAADLERIYAERPIAVVKEIVSAPNERLQTFADAFRIKRDD